MVEQMNRIRWNIKEGKPILEVNEDNRGWTSYESSINYKKDIDKLTINGFNTFLSCRENDYEIEYILPEQVRAYIDYKAECINLGCRPINTQTLGLYNKDDIFTIIYQLPFKSLFKLMSYYGNWTTVIDEVFTGLV